VATGKCSGVFAFDVSGVDLDLEQQKKQKKSGMVANGERFLYLCHARRTPLPSPS